MEGIQDPKLGEARRQPCIEFHNSYFLDSLAFRAVRFLSGQGWLDAWLYVLAIQNPGVPRTDRADGGRGILPHVGMIVEHFGMLHNLQHRGQLKRAGKTYASKLRETAKLVFC